MLYIVMPKAPINTNTTENHIGTTATQTEPNLAACTTRREARIAKQALRAQGYTSVIWALTTDNSRKIR